MKKHKSAIEMPFVENPNIANLRSEKKCDYAVEDATLARSGWNPA